jgi:DNA-binding transcriptional LysR family regulator
MTSTLGAPSLDHQCILGSSNLTQVQLDLNLLTALDALLEEGSVGGAADRLHVSAPAMSRTLARIRRATGDQILVRTGRRMVPTPRAQALRADVHAVVVRAELLLRPEGDLDLDTLARTFTLQCHDAVFDAIGPRLLQVVAASAPHVSLRLLAEAPVDTHELRRGEIDLAIGSAAPTLPDVAAETLDHRRLVAAVRSGHPLVQREVDVTAYAGADHLLVSRRGRLHDVIDDRLAALGLHRRVVASAPTTSSALLLASHTDLVVALPEGAGEPLVSKLELRTFPIPLDLPTVPVIMSWHHRYDDDRGHRWLRELVRELLRPAAPLDPG